MSLLRTLTLATTPFLLGALAACGSTSTPSVHDAAVAFQSALMNDDPAGACSHIDPAAVAAQIAKAGPALAGKDCISLFTTVLTVAKSTGQPILPAKDITVLSQTGDSASVQVTDAYGRVQVSTWKLEDGAWKLVANDVAK